MKVHLPPTLDDALALKAALPAARPLAGGTDLLPAWQRGMAPPADVIALEHLPELRRLDTSATELVIGGAVSHLALAHDARVRAHWPALAEAARSVGAPAIQAMGTIGGNLGTASPAADLPPVLLAYDAQIEVASTRGRRQVACTWFFTGYRRTDLAADELIVAVRVPRPPSSVVARYHKVGTRAAQSIARVALAGLVHWDSGRVARVRLAAASVAPVPVRLVEAEHKVAGTGLEAASIEAAAAAAAASVTPIDDVRATAEYRRYALGALVGRFLREAVREARAFEGEAG